MVEGVSYMFDPLRTKARVMATIALGFIGGLALASGLGWTGPSYAMPTVTQVPQVSDEAVRPALDLSDAFANTAETVTPAVVRIEVTSTERVPENLRRFFRMPGQGETEEIPRQGGGSGFIVSQDGYILTNNHVVEDADDIRVFLIDGRYFTAALVGTDPTTDVAVIKIEEDGLPFLSFGSSEDLRVGEWILAIGNPGFGGGAGAADDLDYTVTAGIVSAKGRPLTLIQGELANDPEFAENAGFAIEDYIQTDAVINRGNSGGPMVNIRGQVVGINSAIYSPSGFYAGYGFAIPIDLASRVMEDLIEYGRVRRAWLGVQISEIFLEDQEAFNLPQVAGVLVQEVTDGGPAEGAGLEQGDVIYRVNGNLVRSPNSLQNLIAQESPGAEVNLEVYRDGTARNLGIRLGEAPLNSRSRPEPPPVAPASEEKLGISVQELSAERAQEFGYDEARGVYVADVTTLGPASRRGVIRGEKILEINGETVSSTDDVREILGRAEAGDVVSLRLGRPDGTSRIVNVRASGG
jgi:serine protease Do